MGGNSEIKKMLKDLVKLPLSEVSGTVFDFN